MKHAEQVPASEMLKPPGHIFYMPVHGVVKESSTTTRLRAVFDASAKMSSGVSLNDQLLAGPTLHPPLTAIITRFRSHKIAVSSDISKMFRGVLLHPEEKDFHRFPVRTKEGALEDWRMCRLTFGVKSSPFLATQTLQQATSLLSSKFPLASKAILDSFYVDDCLTGASMLQEAQDIQQQLCALFSEIGMLICKWRSNSPEFIKDTPEELRDSSTQDLVITEEPADHGKALGIHWNTQADSFHIVTPAIEAGVPTKRAVASAAARIYDLMGWYGPFLLTVKILMQKLWLAGIEWDDPISAEHLLKWKAWSSNLPQLTTHPILRRYDNSESSQLNTSLHVFAEASSKGYGAVVYVRIVYQDTSISMAIVSSRTRVAPFRSKLTIPKLELAAALLAAQLLQIAGKDLNISPNNTIGLLGQTAPSC